MFIFERPPRFWQGAVSGCNFIRVIVRYFMFSFVFLSRSIFQNKIVVVKGISQIILHPSLSIEFANVPQSHALSIMPMKNIMAIILMCLAKEVANFVNRNIMRSKLKTTIIGNRELKKFTKDSCD